MCLLYLRWLLELETGAIELENGHDGLAICDASLQVAIGFPIDVSAVKRIHVVQHVFRNLVKVRLQVTRICCHNVVDKKCDEFQFSTNWLDLSRG